MKDRTLHILTTFAVTGLLVASCASESSTGTPAVSGTESPAASTAASQSANVLEANGLANLNAKELIEKLDTVPVAERPRDLMASIRPDEVIVTGADEEQISLPIPAEDFYLSFAPYVDNMHECYFHSLTICTGEMAHQPVHVTITNNESGAVLVDEDTTTFDNGFAGVWLPAGIEATLTVTADGKSATEVISTKNDDDLTCLTTLKLQ